MATKFQCDICGVIGPEEQHTHDIRLLAVGGGGSVVKKARWSHELQGKIIAGLDDSAVVELCEQCNDKIRRYIVDLWASGRLGGGHVGN